MLALRTSSALQRMRAVLRVLVRGSSVLANAKLRVNCSARTDASDAATALVRAQCQRRRRARIQALTETTRGTHAAWDHHSRGLTPRKPCSPLFNSSRGFSQAPATPHWNSRFDSSSQSK
eukprot:6207240-Pleurochrysis_carterae.AAC.1